ncbi:alpha/beta hydrolase [Pseudokineococcus basanitobsidens]|uniref:Alpha/beta hydrolase n=1 Tax=Pseudokineococcus basanitobsidens TaxID=1926649 RepID=A0ABU8RKU8_9ACTN
MTSDASESRGEVTSRDGTRIGFLRRGTGPGLVLVQGATGTAEHYRELAAALSPHLTVYSPDRRGRGRSPRPYDGSHDIARDVQDVEAVLAETGARGVFGLSSGAVITLEAARTLPQITRAAVYEPPFYPEGFPWALVRRFEAEVDAGDLPSALITSLRAAGTAPAPVRVLPRPVLRLLAAGVLAADARTPGPRYLRLRRLLPGIRYDFAAVGGMDGKVATLASVQQPVLLLSGTRSPAFLQQSVRTLEDVLPRAERVELDGLSHSGPWNRARGGRPAVVAHALQRFFA